MMSKLSKKQKYKEIVTLLHKANKLLDEMYNSHLSKTYRKSA